MEIIFLLINLIFRILIGAPDSDQADVFFRQAVAAQKEGHYQKSIDLYTKVLKIDPECSMSYSNRGAAYDSLGKSQLAFNDFCKALAIDPQDKYALMNRGRIYDLRGNYLLAVKDYKKTIAVDPDFMAAYNNLGWIYGAVSEGAKYITAEQAIKYAEKAVSLEEHPEHLDTLAAVYARAGMFEKAVQTEEKALDLLPEDSKHLNTFKQLIEAYRTGKNYIEWSALPADQK